VRSDFTGQIVDVGNTRLRVGNQIAEGLRATRTIESLSNMLDHF
jgi:hypothetical protein